MKKLIAMLLLAGLLALLSLSAVAYADSRDNHDNGDKDGKNHKLLICHAEDHKVEIKEVEIRELVEHLGHGDFFPKVKEIEKEKDYAVVKFVCDYDKDGHDKDKDRHDKDD
jgi:hypothetical protein